MILTHLIMLSCFHIELQLHQALTFALKLRAVVTPSGSSKNDIFVSDTPKVHSLFVNTIPIIHFIVVNGSLTCFESLPHIRLQIRWIVQMVVGV